MGNYKVKIQETYEYEVEVKANDGTDALKKAKKIYEEDYKDYHFVADATTLEKTDYIVVK